MDAGRLNSRARPDELVALLLALDERDGQEARERRRLDREIGLAVAGTAAGRGGKVDEPLALLRRWLAAAPSASLRGRVERVRRSLARLRGLALGVGLFLGWAAAAALLQIEVHADRINIVLCLVLLVALPAAMLVVSLATLAWARFREDGAVGARAGGLGLRAAALSRAARAMLPLGVREDLERLLGRVAVGERLYGDVQRRQIFAWSQWIGAGFAGGTLLATLLFVVFTDLAFGWSTTLDVDAAPVHRFVRALATPWAPLWPAAVPSFDLVESTRHFRVSDGAPHVHVIDPIRYGGWWPFLVMAIAVYALAPRLLVLAWAEHRLGRATSIAMRRTPGVDRLLERLASPLVETRADEAEGATGRAPDGLVPEIDLATWRRDLGDRGGEAGQPVGHAIVWAEAIDDEALFARLGTDALRVRDAGGRRSLAEDAERVADCAAGEGPVLVCVRAYEPPMLELLDFLGDLRRAIGPERRLTIALLEGDVADHAGWRRKLFSLGDPGIAALVLPGAAQGDAGGVADAAGDAR